MLRHREAFLPAGQPAFPFARPPAGPIRTTRTEDTDLLCAVYRDGPFRNQGPTNEGKPSVVSLA